MGSMKGERPRTLCLRDLTALAKLTRGGYRLELQASSQIDIKYLQSANALRINVILKEMTDTIN